MGAPKQKWTAEEEAALKAGVVKHGAGKWRTILTDPEFSVILAMRSNVDLKDKWRNINVTAIWGSRQKAKLALKRCLPAPKVDNNQLALTVQRDEEVLDAKPLAVSGGAMQSPNLKEQMSRLRNFQFNKYILEAIINMKEPNGSDKASIASYIAEKHHSPSNLRKSLSSKLKHMVATGKIIKDKHKYKIAPSSTTSGKRRSSSVLRREERAKDSLETEKSDDVNIISKPQDAQPSKVKGMTAQEAATLAAQAIAEAEIATAEAEKAAREAAAAEAEAEAAQVFALGVMRALQNNSLHLW